MSLIRRPGRRAIRERPDRYFDLITVDGDHSGFGIGFAIRHA